MGEQNKPAVFDALARAPVVRDYSVAFRQATGLSLKLRPADEPFGRWALDKAQNPLCALMGQNIGACAACRELQRRLRQRLRRKLAPQEMCCFAGLTELVVPVVVGGAHTATLVAGQVFRRKPSRRQYERLARQLCVWGMRQELRRLKQAYFRTPVVADKQFRAAARLLSIFASQLAEHANRCLVAVVRGEPPSVALAKNFVHAHSGEQMKLRQAAEHVHLSPQYFCKTFKKATGLTFTEFVARVRVEKAKSLLANPLLRINEVAGAAGFSSISQFNRVFRRYGGSSPTEYRATLPFAT